MPGKEAEQDQGAQDEGMAHRRARSRSRFMLPCCKRTMLICLGGFAAVLLLVFLLTRDRASASSRAKLYRHRLIATYSHDPKAFTQGLLYYGNNTLYESTGLYGSSSVREVDLMTGKVRKLHRMDPGDFGEGLVLWKDRFLQVTWRTHVVHAYDLDLNLVTKLTHPMQDGWGLTSDGEQIIGSDGTSTLYFMKPETFAEIRRVTVTDGGEVVQNLNELEYVKDEIWANIWLTECIARISPADGKVKGWILLQGMRDRLLRNGYMGLDVLNGIAWDSTKDRLFVTGKQWPALYEIDLVPIREEVPQSTIASRCHGR